MSLTELPTDRTALLAATFARAATVFDGVDRGWKAVVLGLTITAVALLGVQIPW